MTDSQDIIIFARSVIVGNFKNAAADQKRTVQEVREAIKRLEEYTQIQLIKRSDQAIKLTPQGQVFYEKIIDHLEKMTDRK